MNNFIVSGKGFLKPIEFDMELRKFIINWTSQLRDAATYKTYKTATQLIDKHQLDAFVWNPYVEEPIKGKWEVVKRTMYNSFDDDTNHTVLDWIPRRAIMEKKTDVNFLITKGVSDKIYYDSYADAVAACNIKNMEMINELQYKIIGLEDSITNS